MFCFSKYVLLLQVVRCSRQGVRVICHRRYCIVRPTRDWMTNIPTNSNSRRRCSIIFPYKVEPYLSRSAPTCAQMIEVTTLRLLALSMRILDTFIKRCTDSTHPNTLSYFRHFLTEKQPPSHRPISSLSVIWPNSRDPLQICGKV